MADLEIQIKAKDTTAGAIKALNRELDATRKSAQDLGSGFMSTTTRAAALADTTGRVSTTLARSADAFGLNVQALRTMDDVMDVVELGAGNLSKGMAGLNAASIGVAGAGLAVGTAIGSWLNTFKVVRDGADALTGAMYRLLQSQEDLDKQRNATAGLGEFQKKMAESNAAAIAKQVAALKQQGMSVEEIAKFYKDRLSPALTESLGLTEKQIKAGKDVEKAHTEGAARAVREWAETNRVLGESLQQLAQIGASLPELTVEGPGLGALGQTLVGMPELTQQSYENLRKLAEQAAKAGLGAEQIERKLIAAGVPAEDARRITAEITANLEAGAQKAVTLGSAFTTGFGQAIKNLPSVIVGAIQGGGDVTKAVGASIGGTIGESMAKPLSDTLSKALGKTLGPALASLAGPLGALLGSLAGSLVDKIGGALGKLFGGKSEVSKARDQYFSQWSNGFIGLQEQLVGTIGEVGQQDFVKQLFDAKSVEEFNAIVQKIKDTLAGIGKDVPPVTIPVTYNYPGAPDSGSATGGGAGEDAPAMARGGLVLPFVPRAANGLVTARPGGRHVLVGEGGNTELVAPVAALAREIGAAAAAAAGGGGGRDIVLMLDGAVVARATERRMRAGSMRVPKSSVRR